MSDAINKESTENKISFCIAIFKCASDKDSCKYFKSSDLDGDKCRYLIDENECYNKFAVKEELLRYRFSFLGENTER